MSQKRKKWPWIVGGVVALLVVGAIAGGGDDEETVSSSDTTPATTATQAPAAAAPTTVAGVQYPGRQKADRLAGPDGTVELSGFTVTARGFERATDALNRRLLCGDITLRNRDSQAQRYSYTDWRLQTPAGEVRDATVTTVSALESGDLIHGGTTSGKVCFENPSGSGDYVVIWKPDPFNADRGIWLVTV